MSATEPDFYRYHYLYGRHRLEDFLYGSDAPWPQPAPDHPTGQMAQVLHVPRAEMREWKRQVAWKYIFLLLTRWPAGAWYAWRHPHQRALDDEAFSRYLGEGLYSKFLCPLDPEDEAVFAGQLGGAGPDTVFYKSDFSPMAELAGETYPGTHVTPTVVLLRRDGDGPARAVAIHLLDSGVVVTPEDGNRHGWNLARYFALQGAAHRINLIDHAVVHFPSDPINAVTKTLLPKSHPLLKLLLPHFRLSLPVNNSVLEGAESLINRTRWVIYSPFTAPGRIIRRLLPWGYVGRPGNSAYPPYRFRSQPRFPPSLYGEFQAAYHQTIRRYVGAFLAPVRAAPPGSDVPSLVSLWADHVAAWVPGFPDGEAIWAEEVLEDTVATIIWNVSVAHAADHETLHRMPSDEIPFRLRVPPPEGPDAPAPDASRLNRRFDIFQAWLTDMLFYEPHNHSLLQDVDYGFEAPALQRENEAFRQALRQTEARLRDQGRVPIFAPLERIAASIQY
ncbi:hypothetical protein H0Z60_20750 [Ectothiorhodospiraceae bacterium WFHF3C12]|nr:hypothetical protein [Ectothiorhodospiraceae bacterium WFHF3C12]